MNKLFLTTLFGAGLVQVATADNIVSIDGADYNWYEVAPQYLAQSWTSTVAYSNVSISAAVFTVAAGTQTAEAYLMTDLGPTATAADQIASATITLPYDGDSLIPIFSGLNLGAGTYYLLFAGQGDTIDGWEFTANTNLTTGSGITYDGGLYTTSDSAYAPDSTFTPYSLTSYSGRMLATESTVPEPGTCGLLAGGIGLCALLRRRSRGLSATGQR